MLQSTRPELVSLFSTLPILRVFSVVLGTRALIFDLFKHLGEVGKLVILLVVRR